MKKSFYQKMFAVVLIVLVVSVAVGFFFEVRKNSVQQQQTNAEDVKIPQNKLQDSLLTQTKLGSRNLSKAKNESLLKNSTYINQARFYGAYFGIENNKVVFSGENGYANATTKSVFKFDSTFSVGRYQEFLNKAMLYQLISEQKIAIDDKLSTYFPESAVLGKMSVRALLNEKKSLYINSTELAKLNNDSYASTANPQISKIESKKSVSAIPMLEAALISRITRKSYSQAVDSLLMKTMGLQNTRVGGEDTNFQANKVAGYRYTENGGIPSQTKVVAADQGSFGTGQLRMSLADIALSYLNIMQNDYFLKQYHADFLKSVSSLQSSNKGNDFLMKIGASGQLVSIQYNSNKKMLVLVASNFPNRKVTNKGLSKKLVQIMN